MQKCRKCRKCRNAENAENAKNAENAESAENAQNAETAMYINLRTGMTRYEVDCVIMKVNRFKDEEGVKG